MRYLLDTHIILWELIGDEHLSKEARLAIENPRNEIYYSTVSTWEVELKHLKNENFKLSAKQLNFLCNENGLRNIQISDKHVYELENIKKNKNIKHNDPFDRILLAQAISENMILITHDRKFEAYSNLNIMLV